MIPELLTGRTRCEFVRKHPLTSKLLLVVQVEVKKGLASQQTYWRNADIGDFTTDLRTDFVGFKIPTDKDNSE